MVGFSSKLCFPLLVGFSIAINGGFPSSMNDEWRVSHEARLHPPARGERRVLESAALREGHVELLQVRLRCVRCVQASLVDDG